MPTDFKDKGGRDGEGGREGDEREKREREILFNFKRLPNTDEMNRTLSRNLENLNFVNKNSLRKRPQKLVLKSPRKEAFIKIIFVILIQF